MKSKYQFHKYTVKKNTLSYVDSPITTPPPAHSAYPRPSERFGNRARYDDDPKILLWYQNHNSTLTFSIFERRMSYRNDAITNYIHILIPMENVRTRETTYKSITVRSYVRHVDKVFESLFACNEKLYCIKIRIRIM